MSKLKLVGFYLPDGEKRALVQRAQRQHRTVSQLLRLLIEQDARATEGRDKRTGPSNEGAR